MSFTWTLSQADKQKLQKNINSYQSISIMSHIMSDNNCKSKWKLELHKHYNTTNLELKFHPIKVNIAMGKFCMKYKIFLRNSGNDYVYFEDKQLNVSTTYPTTIPQHITMDLILSILESQRPIEIIVQMDIIVLDNDNNIHLISQEIPDFEKLFNDPKFSDFTIICSGKKFNVHKNILAARSAVFSAMFELDMKEKNEGKVIIEDFTPEVVKELLRFMYCGKVENLKELAMNLLRAAKKYCIGALGDLCLESICQPIDTKNALELLSLAVDCQANKMKSKIINFIVFNLKEIRKQPEFNTLEDPSSLREILDKTAQVWL